MSLRDEWKAAKERWLGKKSPIPQEVVKAISGKGFDLGPSLAKFESAKSFEDQQKAMSLVTKGRDGYLAAIDAAIRENPGAASALKKLRAELLEICNTALAMSQPPTPSGRVKEVALISRSNLAGGMRLRWLEAGAIDVHAWITVDEEYQKLVQRGWAEDVHIQMMKAIKEEVDKHTDAFTKTITALDKTVNALSGKDRDDKVREANEVLRYYKNIVEQRINGLVDQLWKERIQRKAHLKSFKVGCRVKIVTSALTVGIAATSVALSFGTAALNLLAVVKGICDLVKTVDKLNRDVEETEKELAKQIKDIGKLVDKRRKAVLSGTGQKLEKLTEVGKELARTALGEAHGLFFKTTSDALALCKEYNGKLRDLEKKRGELYRRIVEFTNGFPSTPDGADARIDKALGKAYWHFLKLKERYESFADAVDQRITFAKKAMTLVEQAREIDSAAKWANSIASVLGMVAGLYSIANLGTFFGTAQSILQELHVVEGATA